MRSAAGAERKNIGLKLMVAFKNFSCHSLLFELSLTVSVATEEDTKKHLLLGKNLIKCVCTQGTFTNPAWQCSDCKLLNNFTSLESDKYCVRVFFSQKLHFSMADSRTKTNFRNTLLFFSSKDNNVRYVFYL